MSLGVYFQKLPKTFQYVPEQIAFCTDIVHMKQVASLMILLLVSLIYSSAQCNYPTTTVLSHQDGIEAYATEYSTCTIHEGDLVITSVNVPDLLDLSSLHFLTEVTGNLTVSGPNLLSLDGIQNIKTVGKTFILQYSNLTTFSPIMGSSLDLGGLIIRGNNSLINIDDFLGLESIDGSISILNNPILHNLTGLNELQSITGSLFVTNNSLLNDCSSLCTILELGIPGSLNIWGNPSPCSSDDELLDHCPTDPCIVNNYISIDQIPIATQTYQAAGITSNALIQNQSDIEFNVNDFVELVINFEVELGAVFYAYTVSCE